VLSVPLGAPPYRINGRKESIGIVSAIQKTVGLPKRGTAIGRLDGQVAIKFDAQSGATSGLDLSDRLVGGHIPRRRSWSAQERTVDHSL
jgi:hypothetical protein